MQANVSSVRAPAVPATVCAAIALAISYAYGRVLSWAAAAYPTRKDCVLEPDCEVIPMGAYVEGATALLHVAQVLMVATAIILLLRVRGVRIPTMVTRAVATAGLGGVPLCYLIADWVDAARLGL